MSPRRTLLVVLLVAVAGCTGAGAPGGSEGVTTTGTTSPTTTATTTADTTEPHTAQGTSHIDEHLTVRATYGVENVTVTLEPNGDTANVSLDPGAQHSFTRAIHDRGHGVRVVVERDGEVVFDQTVRGYEYYQLTVRENDTSVTQSVV